MTLTKDDNIHVTMTKEEAMQMKTCCQFYMSYYACNDRSVVPVLFDQLREAIYAKC